MNAPEHDPESIADLLADDVAEWPRGTWLVIDEYELVEAHVAPKRLVEGFVSNSQAHVLLTSRVRPSWITSRDVLYGEAFELGRSALSMSPDEAQQVLKSAAHAPAGLVDLADGWPAVIGLAALLPSVVNPVSEMQAGLFDYVAQELFDELDSEVQQHLKLLALPSTLSHDTVRSVAGGATEKVLTDCVRAGLITLRDEGELEIHPLCRVFLGRKLQGCRGAEGPSQESGRASRAGAQMGRCLRRHSAVHACGVFIVTDRTRLPTCSVRRSPRYDRNLGRMGRWAAIRNSRARSG